MNRASVDVRGHAQRGVANPAGAAEVPHSSAKRVASAIIAARSERRAQHNIEAGRVKEVIVVDPPSSRTRSKRSREEQQELKADQLPKGGASKKRYIKSSRNRTAPNSVIIVAHPVVRPSNKAQREVAASHRKQASTIKLTTRRPAKHSRMAEPGNESDSGSTWSMQVSPGTKLACSNRSTTTGEPSGLGRAFSRASPPRRAGVSDSEPLEEIYNPSQHKLGEGSTLPAETLSPPPTPTTPSTSSGFASSSIGPVPSPGMKQTFKISESTPSSSPASMRPKRLRCATSPAPCRSSREVGSARRPDDFPPLFDEFLLRAAGIAFDRSDSGSTAISSIHEDFAARHGLRLP